MTTVTDIEILQLVIFGMFGSLIVEFGIIIFIKLGGYPIALYRIFRVPFFFTYEIQPDGEFAVHPHRVAIIENNPNIADMIPHFRLKRNDKWRMHIIDRTNQGRRLGRPVYVYRPNQASNLPIMTGYKDKLISAEELDKAFHMDIVERLRHISSTREKKRKLPWKLIMFGVIMAIFGLYIIYYGARLLF